MHSIYFIQILIRTRAWLEQLEPWVEIVCVFARMPLTLTIPFYFLYGYYHRATIKLSNIASATRIFASIDSFRMLFSFSSLPLHAPSRFFFSWNKMFAFHLFHSNSNRCEFGDSEFWTEIACVFARMPLALIILHSTFNTINHRGAAIKYSHKPPGKLINF